MNEHDSKIRFLSITSDLISVLTFLMSVLSGSLFITLKSNIAFVFTLLFVVLLVLSFRFFPFIKPVAKYMMVGFMNLTAPDKKYRIVTKTIVYEYLSMTEMKLIKEYKIKPLHDGLTFAVDKYRWTGSSSPIPSPVVSTHKIESQRIKYGYEHCHIDFGGKSYNRNDKPIRTGLKFDSLLDPQKTAEPHLATGISECTKNLVLEVWFPMEINVTNIRKLEYIHYTDEEHHRCVEENTPTYDKDRTKKVIRFKVKNPIYGGKYLIDWDFCH
jgi:hypothetical protein